MARKQRRNVHVVPAGRGGFIARWSLGQDHQRPVRRGLSSEVVIRIRNTGRYGMARPVLRSQALSFLEAGGDHGTFAYPSVQDGSVPGSSPHLTNSTRP